LDDGTARPVTPAFRSGAQPQFDAAASQPVWLGWLVLALVLRVLLSANFSGAINPNSAMTGMDFHYYYMAADRLNHGQNLYGQDYAPDVKSAWYIYTPLLAEVMRPIALLPYEKALRLWFFVTSGCLLLAVWLYARAAGLQLRNAVPITLLMVMAMHFWPVTLEQGVGNINSILLVCLCGMMLSARRENDLAIALWIALAAVLKTWMFGLVAYLILRRAWKELGICVAFTLITAALLFAALPSGQFHQFILSNRAMAAQPEMISQSVLAAARRHFTTASVTTPLVDSELLFILANVVGVLLVGGGMAAMWFAGPRLHPYREQLRLGLVMCSMLMLMPVSHQVYHIFDLALIWVLLLPGKRIRHMYTAAALALAVYFVLTMRWPTMNPLPMNVRQGFLSLETSAGLFARLGLWATGLVALFFWSKDLPSPKAGDFAPDSPEAQLNLMDVDYSCD
jgi:hypothetical protein